MNAMASPSLESADRPYASLGDRVLAQLVDLLLAFGLFLVLGSLLARRFGGLTEDGFNLTGLPALALLATIAFGMTAYFILAEALFGRTLGKVVAEIEVRTVDDQPIGMRAAIQRNLMRAIDGFPFFPLYLVGAFSVLLSGRHVRLGDVVAKTIVIRRRIGTLKSTAAFAIALVAFAGGIAGAVALNGTTASASEGPIVATLATAVTGDHQPIEPTSTFASTAPAINLAFRITSVAPGTTLKAVWTAVDVGAAGEPNTVMDETSSVVPGPVPGTFRLRRGGNLWPVGDYRVDLFLDDQHVLGLPYRVVAANE